MKMSKEQEKAIACYFDYVKSAQQKYEETCWKFRQFLEAEAVG